MATVIRGDDDFDTTPPSVGKVVLSSGNISNTSTSFVDVTGASITITTGANPIYIGACFSVRNNNVDYDTSFNFTIDGALQMGNLGVIQDQGSSTSAWSLCSPHVQSVALSAGSHTIKLQWKVAGGTSLMLANGNENVQFFVNEIK